MTKQKWHTINLIFLPAVPLSIENVDTDQIIPARFLKNRTCWFWRQPFRDWRYNNDILQN
jgi:3-isopropylmalate/(R)-2-methylmalate dehydratase small subunit